MSTEYDRAYYQANKEKIKQRTKEWKKKNPERKRELNRAYKERNADKVLAYQRANAGRTAVLNKIRYEAKKDEISEQNRARYERNRDKILAAHKAYRARNREAIRQQQREYKKGRLKSDPAFRLVELCRRRVSNALNGVAAKSARTLDLIGCDGETLRRHIESQFLDGMSWENRNRWHIDHFIPVAHFDLTDPEQQRKCFHYTNLRPLWAEENRKKWANIPLRSVLDP